MKKTVVLMLSLLLCLSLCASAEVFPSGWYSLSAGDDVVVSMFYLPEGCSVSLPDSMSLSPLEAVRPFTAAPGVYSVPMEIPAGKYSIRCDESSSWCTVTIRDENEKLVLSQTLRTDEGNFVGSIPVLDGYSVEVEKGSARFDAAVGVTFD